eukprot:5847012-Prymnesium_polylepis.2
MQGVGDGVDGIHEQAPNVGTAVLHTPQVPHEGELCCRTGWVPYTPFSCSMKRTKQRVRQNLVQRFLVLVAVVAHRPHTIVAHPARRAPVVSLVEVEAIPLVERLQRGGLEWRKLGRCAGRRGSSR